MSRGQVQFGSIIILEKGYITSHVPTTVYGFHIRNALVKTLIGYK